MLVFRETIGIIGEMQEVIPGHIYSEELLAVGWMAFGMWVPSVFFRLLTWLTISEHAMSGK